MFCEKCGNKLEEDALFCTKCGAKIGESKEPKKEDMVDDKDIQLNVKPTFKFVYMLFMPFAIWFIFILIMSIIMELTIAAGEGPRGVGLIMGGCTLIAVLIVIAIKLVFNKLQYKHLEYNFYKTKVIFEDSFLNLSQKEVKYKYIREVTMRQSFVQRWFNIGNILLYTNAETGFGNGITIINVENVQEVYNKIKEIINV